MARLDEVLEKWEPVIGLEVHAQLSTRSKLFCGCSAQFGAAPNTHTCEVCLGLPGALPVLNGEVVRRAVTLGLALGCEIRTRSLWARKNYFYPDLPKGYQISQFELPICEHGSLTFETDDGVEHTAGIVRIHMEEDAGKSVHDAGADVSLVDLNRACVPLLEIVTGPDLRSAQQASAFLRTLRTIVRYLRIGDGNMEEGSMRCDANVSLRLRGEETLGTRAEVKNINSFRFLQKAIEYEIVRQANVLEDGGKVVQETRLYDSQKDETRSMRSKEDAHDYRYFPDPDLPPLVLPEGLVEERRAALPELPQKKAARFVEMGVAPDAARELTDDRDVAEWFEAALEAYGGSPRKVANWMQQVRGELGPASKMSPARLAALLSLIDAGTVSSSAAKDVLAQMSKQGGEPADLVKSMGLEQVSDVGQLEAIVDTVIAENPEQAEKYRGGRKNLLSFFVGQVMKKTQGKANPRLTSDILRRKLG